MVRTSVTGHSPLHRAIATLSVVPFGRWRGPEKQGKVAVLGWLAEGPSEVGMEPLASRRMWKDTVSGRGQIRSAFDTQRSRQIADRNGR